MNNPERRYISHEFRVSPEGESPTISGYAALFDTPSVDLGGWTEVLDPHAFDAVMASNPDVRALWNHNPDCVLGRTIANTLTLNVDARGLAYVIDPPNTSIANDLIVSMRRKDVTGSSFGFITKRDQWTDNTDGTISRRILEFDELLDVSPVTFPAYSATTSQARNLPTSMPKEMRSKLATRSISDGLIDVVAEDDDPPCGCQCPQCLVGACNICSADDCVDEACSCYNQRSQSVGDRHVRRDSERRRMEMKLALLSIAQ
jgi:HK97 family phage prohead protease